MLDVTLRCEVVRRIGIIGNAPLEALVRRQIHVAGVSHRRAVNDETISEGLKQIFAQGDAPDTCRILLHRQRSLQDVTVELHTVGLRCLHAESDALFGILRRDHWTWEQTGHRSTCELLFLTGLGRCGLAILHGFFRSLLVEQQAQGLVEEILSIHPSMTELVVGKLLHRGDTLLIEELHIVAGVAIEEIVRTHAEPEQMNLLVGSGCIVVNLRNGR